MGVTAGRYEVGVYVGRYRDGVLRCNRDACDDALLAEQADRRKQVAESLARFGTAHHQEVKAPARGSGDYRRDRTEDIGVDAVGDHDSLATVVCAESIAHPGGHSD